MNRLALLVLAVIAFGNFPLPTTTSEIESRWNSTRDMLFTEDAEGLKPLQVKTNHGIIYDEFYVSLPMSHEKDTTFYEHY